MNNELDVTHIENILSEIKHQKFHVIQSTTKKQNYIALFRENMKHKRELMYLVRS